MATYIHNLAALYRDIQQHEECEKLYLEAVGIQRKLAESNPQAYLPNLATHLNNLALYYFKYDNYGTNRLEESEKMFLEAVEIRRKLGENNPQAYLPDFAKSLDDLAFFYYAIDRFEDSEKIYKEAFGTWFKVVENNSQVYLPDFATSCTGLALLYSTVQRLEESEGMYMVAVEIYRLLVQDKSKEEYHNMLYTTLGDLSYTCLQQGKFEKAEQVAREGIEVDNTQTLIYSKLATALLLQGKFSEAEKIYSTYKTELKDAFLKDFWFLEIPEERKTDVERIKRMLRE